MGEARHSFGPFVLVPGRELRRDDVSTSLGGKALAVLQALLDADGAVVTKDELMKAAWPGVLVEEGNLTVQVAALRKELGTRDDAREWIITVPRVGYRFARDVASPTQAATPSGPPAVAVLPFLNLSGDPAKNYFADGIVEELIAALSRFKSFAVIARNSSFAYRDRNIDVRQIAHELGVRYVLEGSVRLAGERVRVTAQLVDAESGAHHWAHNFDGDLGQIFEFQDRIAESVVGLVEPQIRRAEIERTRRRWPDSPRAYDHFLRALPAFYERDPARYLEALVHLERAIDLEPDYSEAMAFASWAYARRGTMGLEALGDADSARCIDLARRALQFGGDDAEVIAICAHSLLAIGRMQQEGLALVRRAREANPNNLVVLNQAGICNMLAGDLDEAEACFMRAFQLSPGAMGAYESIAGVGFARYFKGDYAGAIEWLQRSRETLVDWPPTHWLLAAAYANSDQPGEAKVMVEQLLRIAPHTTLERLEVIAPRFGNRWLHMRDGLARAGLK